MQANDMEIEELKGQLALVQEELAAMQARVGGALGAQQGLTITNSQISQFTVTNSFMHR